MNKQITYTDAPADIEESLDRAVIIPIFEMTPEGIRSFNKRQTKKAVSIYLSTETIEWFERAANESDNKFQTLISDVLDAYKQKNLQSV